MIRFQSVVKRFGEHLAVDALTLEIGIGEVVALLGPNGSGKTTSLKMAAGLIHPTAGGVLVGGQGLPAEAAAARWSLSYLPQKVGFPDALTGREVVEFYRRLRRVPAIRTDEVLHIAALNGAAERPVGTYSGGMTQRLGLAVAALPGAPLLLLDEPTASLDPAGLDAFYVLVEAQRAAGGTVMFTSHQLGDVARLADRIGVLVAGRLVALLSQAELAERLAVRGLMRVRLDDCPPALVAKLTAMAPGTAWHAGLLSIPGAADTRAAALEVVRASGVQIRSLSADEGRLDSLYHELTGGLS